MDNDGDDDLLLGNAGINTQFHASEKEPMTEVVSDFDKNVLLPVSKMSFFDRLLVV